MTDELVHFCKCTQSEYDSISSKSESTFYATTDTCQMYLGSIRLGRIRSTSYSNGIATIDGVKIITHGELSVKGTYDSSTKAFELLVEEGAAATPTD